MTRGDGPETSGSDDGLDGLVVDGVFGVKRDEDSTIAACRDFHYGKHLAEGQVDTGH